MLITNTRKVKLPTLPLRTKILHQLERNSYTFHIFEISRQPYEILKNEKEISYVVVNSYEQPTRSTSHGSKQQDDFHWKENAFPAKLRPEENVGAAGRRFRKRLASGDKPSRVPIASAFCTVIKRLHRRNSRYVVYASFNHRLSAPGRLGS